MQVAALAPEGNCLSADLSNEDLVKAFRRATSSMSGAGERWAQRAQCAMSDKDLAIALEFEIGQIGESYFGPTGIACEGHGLKIWVGEFPSRHKDKPILHDAQTIRLAREVYGVADPAVKQMGMFAAVSA